MDRDHIGYLIDVNFERGGAPISTKILAEEMSNWYDVSILKPHNMIEPKTDLRILPINEFTDNVPFMLFHPLQWLRLCRALEKVIKASNYQILHAHMPNVGMALGFLKMCGKIDPSIKLVYTDREHVAYLRWIHRIRYQFFIGSCYDAVITLSESNYLYWKRTVKAAKVVKIYNTASKEFEGDGFREIYSSPLKVIMVGRIVSDKGWPLGIDIIKNAPQHHYTIVMSFFNEEQQKEAEELLAEVKNNSNVEVYFNLSLSEIKKLYQQSDILVMPSKRESFGRTAVEAMSQSCVVIGTQVGGLPEVIGKKENCLPRQTSTFCERLKFYSNNPDELEKDKILFFTRYLQNFSTVHNIEKHRMLYTSLLEEKTCIIKE